MAEKTIQIVPMVAEGRVLYGKDAGVCIICTQSTMGYCGKHQIFVGAFDNCQDHGLPNEYQRAVLH